MSILNIPVCRDAVIHRLKCWPEFFRNPQKNFEIRFNDRDYQVDDFIHLQEYDPRSSTYTGYEQYLLITYILSSSETPGLADGFVLLGTATIYKSALNRVPVQEPVA